MFSICKILTWSTLWNSQQSRPRWKSRGEQPATSGAWSTPTDDEKLQPPRQKHGKPRASIECSTRRKPSFCAPSKSLSSSTTLHTRVATTPSSPTGALPRTGRPGRICGRGGMRPPLQQRRAARPILTHRAMRPPLASPFRPRLSCSPRPAARPSTPRQGRRHPRPLLHCPGWSCPSP